jgi:glycosyltransferase involved in cell wall biosynthesis
MVLVSFPGVLDTIVLAPFARLRRVPVVWDMFMSVYDTLAFDRELVPPRSLLGRLLRRLEEFAIRRADLVFLDTEAHARRIESLFELPPRSCKAVWVGAEMEHFGSDKEPVIRQAGEMLQVLFYGQFIPLHGIETIVEAARLMRDEPVMWTLVGRGQEAQKIGRILRDVSLPKLKWVEWVDYSELREWIS